MSILLVYYNIILPGVQQGRPLEEVFMTALACNFWMGVVIIVLSPLCGLLQAWIQNIQCRRTDMPCHSREYGLRSTGCSTQRSRRMWLSAGIRLVADDWSRLLQARLAHAAWGDQRLREQLWQHQLWC